MPLSRYCKIYPSPDEPSTVSLFSTLTTAVVEVHEDVLQDIEKNKLSKAENKILTDLGFLVKSRASERRDMLRAIDDLNKENDTFLAVVAMNLDCNLGCRYCYEGTRKGSHYMNGETADAFVDFVKTAAGKRDKIDIQFYGGEPLLSVDTIIRIAKGIRTFARKKGIGFRFAVITNGTLLTPEVVWKLKPLGLRAVKVTVSGPRKVHDALRPFKSGTGSFGTIIRNIKNVASQTAVHIAGNYTQSTYREFPRLLDHLIENDLGPENISTIEFDPVFQESKEFAPPDFHDGCMSSNEPWLRDASLFLRKEILERGFRAQIIEPTVCSVEQQGHLVVNYNGDLYKCPGLIGRKKYRIGSVTTGIGKYEKTHKLGNWKNEKCLACAYLPLCFGGCRYMKLLRDGTMRGVDCKKQYFDRALEALVHQDVRHGL